VRAGDLSAVDGSARILELVTSDLTDRGSPLMDGC